MARPSSRDRILRTALAIVRRDGFGGATVDAVTAEANVSRGGFLYHFPTKQRLIFAMLDSEFQRFSEGVERHAQALPDGPGRRLKAYIELWIEETRQSQDGLVNVMTLLHEPASRERILSLRKQLLEQLMDPAIPDIVARIVFLTCDGLWCMNMVADVSDSDLAEIPLRVAAELFHMIDRSAADMAAAPRPA